MSFNNCSGFTINGGASNYINGNHNHTTTNHYGPVHSYTTNNNAEGCITNNGSEVTINMPEKKKKRAKKPLASQNLDYGYEEGFSSAPFQNYDYDHSRPQPHPLQPQTFPLPSAPRDGRNPQWNQQRRRESFPDGHGPSDNNMPPPNTSQWNSSQNSGYYRSQNPTHPRAFNSGFNPAYSQRQSGNDVGPRSRYQAYDDPPQEDQGWSWYRQDECQDSDSNASSSWPPPLPSQQQRQNSPYYAPSIPQSHSAPPDAGIHPQYQNGSPPPSEPRRRDYRNNPFYTRMATANANGGGGSGDVNATFGSRSTQLGEWEEEGEKEDDGRNEEYEDDGKVKRVRNRGDL